MFYSTYGDTLSTYNRATGSLNDILGDRIDHRSVRQIHTLELIAGVLRCRIERGLKQQARMQSLAFYGEWCL